MDCVFCQIATGDIPSKQCYSDDDVVAFNDMNPAAPVHVLVIPRKHIAKISEMNDADEQLVGKMLNVARKVAAEMGLSESGFRLVMNTGSDAQQSVFHIHLHLLGGRWMSWPPG